MSAVPIPHRLHLSQFTPAEESPLPVPAAAPLGGNVFMLMADWSSEA